MRIGVALRVMGDAASAELLARGAARAEQLGLDSLWVVDHIAIPPDDAEGSGGLYLDPLATLGWLAAQTRRIGLGTAVLVLPYRAALPTAKVIATLQALSGERLLLGCGIGWMKAEFRAVGVARRERARIADATLAFMRDCFASDIVEANGQPLLFRPRPAAPPFIIGGAAPHAIARALRLGDGWMPMNLRAPELAPLVADYRARAAAAGRAAPRIVTFLGGPLIGGPRIGGPRVGGPRVGGPRERLEGLRHADAFAAAGVTDLIVAGRYVGDAEQDALLEFAAALKTG